ncbi:MAG: GP88 family protein, partial [Gemmataceae bacterium]
MARNRLADRVTGGLSAPGKMPCLSWGISAARCRVGSVLAAQPGTTCEACYARKGTYRLGNVQRKLEERYEGVFHPLWTPSMVFLVRYFCDRYFRWFDSGDLQGAS